MNFTCKYCGEKYCSEHRLPENHDCTGLEKGIKEEKKESRKWFEEKEVRNEITPNTREPSKPSMIEDIKRTFSHNYTLAIIAVTSFVFLIQMLIGAGPQSGGFYDLLILQPGLMDVLSQPWTLFTVMILHAGMFHLFANMVTLYFFGNPVEKTIGSKKFLKFYIVAGLAASLGYVITQNFFALYQGSGVLGPAVGASGAVVATFAVVAMLYPEAEVLLYFVFPMKIRTALYAFAGLEAFNLFTKAIGYSLPVIGGFASSAHLTGLLVGMWYGKRLKEKYGRRTTVFDPLGY